MLEFLRTIKFLIQRGYRCKRLPHLSSPAMPQWSNRCRSTASSPWALLRGSEADLPRTRRRHRHARRRHLPQRRPTQDPQVKLFARRGLPTPIGVTTILKSGRFSGSRGNADSQYKTILRAEVRKTRQRARCGVPRSLGSLLFYPPAARFAETRWAAQSKQRAQSRKIK